MKDRIEAYWDERPCNIRHGTAEVGTKEYFEQVSRRKYFVEPHIPGFADFEHWRHKRVLEVGCGIGTDAASFVEAGAHYTGLELSGESLALTKKRFEVCGLFGRFHQCDAELLGDVKELSGQQVDLVYSFGVLHHTPHPERVVEQVKQYMGPGSEFRLMVYARNSWKRAMIDGGLDQPEAANGCPLARTYTKPMLAELLDDFDIIEMRQDHIFPYRWQDYVKHEYVKQPWFEAMTPEVFRVLEQNFGWHLLARCKLK